MPVKAILFDLDGTLLDSLPLILECFYTTMNRMDITPKREEIIQSIGLPLRDVCAHFAGKRGQEFFERYLEYQDKIHDSYIQEYPGTKRILQYLIEKKYKIGIVTSKRRIMAQRGLRVTGLESYLDTLVALEDSERPKPEGDPVARCLERLGIIPSEAVYAGDSPYDIRCGKNAKTYTAGVTWGISSRETLAGENPDIIIDKWNELMTFLHKFSD